MKQVENSNLIVRASKAGALMHIKQGHGITERQLVTLKEMENKQIAFGKGEGKGLTEKQALEYVRLCKKRDAPPELSDTAKAMIRERWLETEKGVRRFVTSKYMEKGLYAEEDAISLLTDLDGKFYKKNTERKTNKFFTGECDIDHKEKNHREVQDTKVCWSANTFIDSVWNVDYEWQGRVYMDLFDADLFKLRYVLLDCPDHIFAGEEYKFKLSHNMIDESLPENEALLHDFRMAHIFSENPAFQELEERVKTYTIERDDQKFKEIMEMMPQAREYYNGLKLNQRLDIDALQGKGIY